MTDAGVLVPIRHDVDVVIARQQGRELAATLGFTGSDLTLIATAISEVARNILVYAGQGEIVLAPARENGRCGIRVVAADNGPGIPDIEMALRDGFSTGKSLGLGLPGARRMVDDFDIVSSVGMGTTVTLCKWVLP